MAKKHIKCWITYASEQLKNAADPEYLEYMEKKKKKKISKEPTIFQSMHSRKFITTSKFISVANTVINLGYANVHKKRVLSEVNVAFRHIMKDAFTIGYPDFILDYSKIRISRGNLCGAEGAELLVCEDGKLKVSWPAACLIEYPDPNDEVIIFIYNEARSSGFSFLERAKRSDLSVELLIRSARKEDVLHCWVFMVAVNGKATSESTYMKAVI